MKRTLHDVVCGVTAACFLTIGAASQDHRPGDPLGDAKSAIGALCKGVIPIHTSDPDVLLGPYGIWAASERYKVSFHTDMTFIPYLGDRYPHNQPLSWRTESVTFGGRSLMSQAETVARRHWTDTRYEYRFGAITEAYDVREDGVEQTFVIHERPAGAGGDLVVVGRIDSRLRGTPFSDQHRAITFRDADGRDILRYGAA